MTQPAPPAAGPVRVLIVDDHALVRSGVRAQLDGHVTVIGEAHDVAPAIEAVLATQPDVVLLDIHLPSGTGADVITALPGGGFREQRIFLFNNIVMFSWIPSSTEPPATSVVGGSVVSLLRRPQARRAAAPAVRDQADLPVSTRAEETSTVADTTETDVPTTTDGVYTSETSPSAEIATSKSVVAPGAATGRRKEAVARVRIVVFALQRHFDVFAASV